MSYEDDFEEQLKKAGEFHGEICGGITIGTKLAMYGMNLMNLELNKRHKNLIVFIELDRCMADAVQVVTKCTIGKRSLKQMSYGKFATTFYNMETGEAIRIVDIDKDINKKESKEEMIERFKKTPPEELFKVQKVKINIPDSQKPGQPHSSIICSICGEIVADNYHLIKNNKPVCLSCAEKPYYEIIEE